jgi:hypothetical protein
MKNRVIKFAVAELELFFMTAVLAFALATAFNYQGRLTKTRLLPTANYDFEFCLISKGSVIIAGQSRLIP